MNYQGDESQEPVLSSSVLTLPRNWIDWRVEDGFYLAVRLADEMTNLCRLFQEWRFYVYGDGAWEERAWEQLSISQWVGVVKAAVDNRVSGWWPLQDGDVVPWDDEIMAVVVLGEM